MKIFVLGAGLMGTAISSQISKNVENVYLWARRKDVCQNIQRYQINLDYYPDNKLSKNIIPINDLEHIENSDIIFFTVPSHAVRDIAREIKQYISDKTIIVSTAKGIEYPPFHRMSEIITEELNTDNIVVLSGPNFADEIINDMYSATTISSCRIDSVNKIKDILKTDKFSVEISNDVIGVELCGILKNICAIAIGICESIGLNENARYAVLTESFNEMTRIILSFGGKLDTVFCYSGFGDLCLTSHSEKSRNKTIGQLYGKKMFFNDHEKNILAEGKKSILGIKNFCDQNGVRCDLTDFVYKVIYEKKEPKTSFYELWKNIKN